MKPMFVYDKLNNDTKEVAVINYVEKELLLWTGSGSVRATTKRNFDQVIPVKYMDEQEGMR